MNFDDFLRFIFDREPSTIEWYFEESFEELELNPSQCLEYFSRICFNCAEISNKYDEKQICMGMQYLINGNISSFVYKLFDSELNLKDVVETMESMYVVFSDLFSVRCHPHPKADKSRHFHNLTYNASCYMWWDVFPRHGTERGAGASSVDDAVLKTINKVLQLDNYSCKESAIHGLGHWSNSRARQVEEILERALPSLPEDLVSYASLAKIGKIQ